MTSAGEIKVRIIRDWRFRLGLWVLSIGIRILGASPRIEAQSTP